jgi:hypothetical protein
MTFVMKDSDMKKYTPWGSGLFWVLGCLFLIMGFSGCGQEPLFYHISYEEEPVDPLIEGGPGKIVADSAGKLYISNGRLFSYVYDSAAQTGTWSRLGGELGTVRDVALVGDTLYAMTIDGSNTEVRKQEVDASWKPLTNSTDYSFVQGIFGAGDRLFVSARKTGTGSAEDYGILYEDGGTFSLLSAVAENLSGAIKIGGNYYLATAGNGIFEVPEASLGPNMSPSPLTGTEKLHIIGLLELEGKPAAITRSGGIIIYDPPSGKLQSFSYGSTFTGAFALWKNPDDPAKKLFLVGIRSSSSSQGYREIPIRADGTLGAIQAPGQGESGWTTVSNNAKYNSSLEKHAVNSIFVAPTEVSTEDSQKYPVIFASTQQDGLWVYRNGSWKAQE